MTIPLGAAIRHEWRLDPEALIVNHGSFGATPLVVQAAQDEWRRRLEAEPTRFMSQALPGLLRGAAAELGRFLGVDGQDIGFVTNATTGCNAVLRSLRFQPGDEILALSHVYGAVGKTIAFVASRTGAVARRATLPFPRPDDEAILANVAAALTPHTRLAVIDHITSSSAVILPLARIVALCHAAGVPVLVDGAHAPGQLELDLAELGADWYTGNCHKWLSAPKGCAFLYARRDRQADLHPAVISHGYGDGFTAEFDWTGTLDPSAWLSVGAALAFHDRLGGPALMARNRELAFAAGNLLAARFGTETGTGNAPGGAMAMVRLPGAAPAGAAALRERLFAAGTDVPLHAHGDALWLRLSAYAYNELDDYARLGEIIERSLR